MGGGKKDEEQKLEGLPGLRASKEMLSKGRAAYRQQLFMLYYNTVLPYGRWFKSSQLHF